MKFLIDEATIREMIRLEDETGCEVSAGPDWGIHLDKVLEFVLDQSATKECVDEQESSDRDVNHNNFHDASGL
jgi:hypothetical protein